MQKGVLIIDDSDDFARKIFELIDDPKIREKIGKKDGAKIEPSLSWRHQRKKLIEAYSTL
jgi:glycosyltransferase involved in cell wall biosynthesis